MKEGGVDLPKESTDILLSNGNEMNLVVGISKKLEEFLEESKLAAIEPKFVMVIGYIDGPTQYQLDLVGGRRRLGESTLEDALREVEEECSLKIDKGWMEKRVSKEFGGTSDKSIDPEGLVKVLAPYNGVNAFFIVTRPQCK